MDIIRRSIQKVATGPEYSKDLSYDEAYQMMTKILQGSVDPVQTAIILIALRMKRESDDENLGYYRQSLILVKDRLSMLMKSLMLPILIMDMIKVFQ